MKLLLRSLVILLAGIALALAFLPLGSTSWADNMRTRRGGRGRPPGAMVDPQVRPPATSGSAIESGQSPNNASRGGRGGNGQPPPGGRGGRGGNPGLFSHFNGRQSLVGDALRFTQILVLQIGIPAGLTLAALAYARRNRRSPARG
ncbi:MAG: hypothetical protein RL324_1510 [Verrucomicrobiota bacterium]|jgi:hypothetical protein